MVSQEHTNNADRRFSRGCNVGMNSKSVAVIGCNGYLGRHIVRSLQCDGFSCCGYDMHESASADCRIYRQCDITRQDFWLSLNPLNHVAIVFLAGLSGVEKSFVEPERFLSVNVMGLLRLLESLKGLGSAAPRIIFTSSRLVYEGGGEVGESASRMARSVYAATKIACEELLSAYHSRYGIPYIVLRICVPYGNLVSKDYSYGTMGFFLNRVRQGVPITIWGDGSIRKTYTYIGDICKIVSGMCSRSLPSGIFNVGGHDYSLREVAELVIEKFGGSFETIPYPEEAQKVEMGNISLLSNKLDGLMDLHYERLEDHLNEL